MTTTITAKSAQKQTQQQQQHHSGQVASNMNGFRITGYPAAASNAVNCNPSTSSASVASSSSTSPFTVAMSNVSANKIHNNNGSNNNNSSNHPIYAKPLRNGEHELDLHISESLLYPGSTQQLQASPGPPPQLTSMLQSSASVNSAIAPIALKGNNPFLNSPSPTETPLMARSVAATTSTSGPLTAAGYEMPEYAEPQRLRGLKQRPHSIAVASTSASTGASSTRSCFVDYAALQQQQQRLMQLSRQQQQLRNAVSMVSSGAHTTTTSTTSTGQLADKEALYAAIFQQYRQSPTQLAGAAAAPPVPQHRQVGAASAPGLAVPAVPRRSHSTPRQLQPSAAASGQLLPAAQPLNGQLNGNTVQRPRSLDRFNSGHTETGTPTRQSPYQPPPIPLRRFAGSNNNNGNGTLARNKSPAGGGVGLGVGVAAAGGDGTPKLQCKKSSSIDNMLGGMPPSSGTAGMRHSLTFHAGQEISENGEHGVTSNVKQERPTSYAYGAAASNTNNGPDQAYLEHQLRTYSEQLRTITESVRKYSEQAKLLSELKRQQLAKQSQTNLNLLTPNSHASSGNNNNNNTATHSNHNSNNNFQSNMISPEIVSKSLASVTAAAGTEPQTPSNQLRLFLDNIRSSMRQEYQQHMPEDVLKAPPAAAPLSATLKRNTATGLSSPQREAAAAAASAVSKTDANEPPTPSDQLRQFLDAIRANKIPETTNQPKLSNSQTLDSFISKPLQMPDVTSGTPGVAAAGLPLRRRPKSSVISGTTKLEQREHSLVTSESFHQISDNLRLMSEDLQALSPSKVVSSSASNGSLKTLAINTSNSLTSELRVITSSPYSTSPQMVMSKSNCSLTSAATGVTTPSSATTTPSTAPLLTDFNEILDSFQAMADKYKSKGSYDYLRKCSEALRQHSQQLKLQQQQQQQQHLTQQQLQQQQQQPHQFQNGFNGMSSDDSSSCSTTPGSIREAVQNLLLQPRNGFQILDDRMRLFIDIIDSQDRLSQDLQSEIETHRVVYDRLDGTGRKLLGSLTSQEDAVMLQRRLDEMNQRWNNLKSKSIAIRNRLESNSEHWNALLLSLRELTEWVIRKDTELSTLGLGPVRGDAASLQKQLDDHKAFRRQLEDKRPIVESNLTSGRQYIASEAPVSDTSDTEAQHDSDSRYLSAEEQSRELTRSIRREVAKLSEQWNNLIDRSDNWKHRLDEYMTQPHTSSTDDDGLLQDIIDHDDECDDSEEDNSDLQQLPAAGKPIATPQPAARPQKRPGSSRFAQPPIIDSEDEDAHHSHNSSSDELGAMAVTSALPHHKLPQPQQRRSAAAGPTRDVQLSLTPEMWEQLPLQSELKELFPYILKYTPQTIDTPCHLQPFIPEYVPAVGDVDALLKVVAPPLLQLHRQAELDEHFKRMGLWLLDEPSGAQSEPSLLNMKLRSVLSGTHGRNARNASSATLVPTARSPKDIDKWIGEVEQVHMTQSMHDAQPRKDIDALLEDWPRSFAHAETTAALEQAYSATLQEQMTLPEYVRVLCERFGVEGPLDNQADYIHNVQTLFALYLAASQAWE